MILAAAYALIALAGIVLVELADNPLRFRDRPLTGMSICLLGIMLALGGGTAMGLQLAMLHSHT